MMHTLKDDCAAFHQGTSTVPCFHQSSTDDIMLSSELCILCLHIKNLPCCPCTGAKLLLLLILFYIVCHTCSFYALSTFKSPLKLKHTNKLYNRKSFTNMFTRKESFHKLFKAVKGFCQLHMVGRSGEVFHSLGATT